MKASIEIVFLNKQNESLDAIPIDCFEQFVTYVKAKSMEVNLGAPVKVSISNAAPFEINLEFSDNLDSMLKANLIQDVIKLFVQQLRDFEFESEIHVDLKKLQINC